MTSLADRIQAYNEAVSRALAWITSHQEADGGFGPGVETMSHHMVLGATLLYTGHPDSAVRLMPYLRGRFVKPEGGFDPPEVRHGRQSALLERGYAPAWMIYSSHVNLAFDISLGGMRELLELQDPVSGGLFGTVDDAKRGRGIINAAVTTVACQAALATGHLTAAMRMADHLADNLVEANPDLNRYFYPVWDTEAGLRTDPEAPIGPNMPRVIVRGERDQHHFLTGMMIGVLADAAAVFRNRKYLDAALMIYEFVARCAPEVYSSTASHKLAWGCAWLYRRTGDVRHLESACRVCDYLARIQEPDGSFVHWAFVRSAEEWPYSPRLNITAQFALWIARTLHVLTA